MEKINISGAFRDAMRADGTHGVDSELVTEGLGSTLARFADKAVGGLFAKNVTSVRRKMDSWSNSFKEAMGDIGHTIRRDIEKISENGSNAQKWSQVVSGDLTKHVTHGLTGKGGMPADFKIPTLKLPNGKKANDIPLAWGICCQSNLFDLIKGKRDDLPSMQELLGTVANTINIAAYIAGAKQYGSAPYEDICSYIAAGAGGQLPPATEYDEEKDNRFKESMVSLFQNGWRPANMQAMAGTINIICSQLFVQSFVFLADNKICAFTDQWYNANRQLWGWTGENEPDNDACKDFDAQVQEHLIKANTANSNGPLTDAQVAVASVEALEGLISGGVGESVVNEDGGFDDKGDPEDNIDDDPEVKKAQGDNTDGKDPEADDTDYGQEERSGEDQDDGSMDGGDAPTFDPRQVVSAIESKVKNFQSQKTKGEFVKIKSAAKDAVKDKSSFDAFKNLVSEFLKSIGATNPVSDAVEKAVGEKKLPEFQEKVDKVNDFIEKCEFKPAGNGGTENAESGEGAENKEGETEEEK